MIVKQVEITEKQGTIELSALLGNERLWFRFPEFLFNPAGVGDAFLCAALLPSMKAGEPLVLESPVSSRLMDRISEIQLVWKMWNPDYKLVPIEAETTEPPQSSNTKPTSASFYSGGVDSSHTFLRHKDNIDYLMLVQGIDMHVTNNELFKIVLDHNEKFARAYDKTLVTIQTNLVHYARRAIGTWRMFSGLQCIAFPLNFKRVYIPASHTYSELFPLGSHPLLDPMWTTEHVEFIHDGAGAYRSDKLKVVSTDPLASQLLRVCWYTSNLSEGEMNCGRCEKCLRTMTGLRALRTSAPTLPKLKSVRNLKNLRIETDGDYTFFQDNLNLAAKSGDKELESVLRWILNKAKIRRALVDLDEAVCGGYLKNKMQPLLNRRYSHNRKETANLFPYSNDVDISLVR